MRYYVAAALAFTVQPRPFRLRPRKPGAVNCKRCAKFKSKPSSVCGWCGDDPVTHHGSRTEYDRAVLGE